MNWLRIRPWAGTVVRLFLGAVWIWAAVSKLGSPRTFTQAVRAYQATPEWLSKSIGYGLPVLEFSVGLLLVLGIAVRVAAMISATLFVVFLIGIISVAARGIKLECGCFGGGGSAQSTTYTLDILRDLGLLVLAAYLVVWSVTRVSVEEYLSRNDHVEAPSAKRMRTDQGRRKYNAMLEQRRAAARSRSRWVNVSAGVVVILIALIGLGVQSGRAKIEGSLTATNASVDNGVVYGTKAAATVDTYEDFQCPICREFESSARATLDADVKANKIQLRVHMISILDASSNGNRYSSRAANAGYCASDISVNAFILFHNFLYGSYGGQQVQPAEDADGRSDGQIEAYAKEAGIPAASLTQFNTCVSSETHKALVEAVTERASEKNINATPTVLVNGKSVTASLSAVTKAIAAADAKGPAPTPAPAPSSAPASSVPVIKPSTAPATKPTTAAATKPTTSAATKPTTSATKPTTSATKPTTGSSSD